MADRDATLRGILEKNKAATGAGTAAYHLNHVTIELDASGVGAIDEGLEGLPVSVEGHFEMREHPESGTRWVFKAHLLRGAVPADDVPDEDIVAETGDVAHDEPAGGEDVAMSAQTTRRAVPSDAPRTQDPPPRTGDAPPSPSDQPPR
ncbi:MAG: hypothetical protein M3305_10350 [Actinomycetota bacterium]|jgi:hypothetical protein|nr:hypothetical protein [Actinomycetota bacterium]